MKNRKHFFFVSKLLIWCQKWFASLRHGNLPILCGVSPGRIIVVLLWTKYAVPHQIKPGVHKFTFRRGQSNFSIAFIFVSFEEKDYRVDLVHVGQLSFDCCSYCGCMQGICKLWLYSNIVVVTFTDPGVIEFVPFTIDIILGKGHIMSS